MAKRRRMSSFSHLLFTLGEAIHFAPASAFAPAKTETWQEREKPFPASRLKIKTALAKTCEQSFFLGLYASFVRGFFTTRLRSLGVLFFTCGFLQILSYFWGGYLPFAAGDENNMVYGVTLIFLALLCAFSRGDVKDVLKKSFLYRGVLEPLYGSDGWSFPGGRNRDNFLGMILTGTVLAFFSVLFSPIAVLSVLLMIGLVLFVFYQPEAGLSTVATALFFAPFRMIVFLTAVTALSFFCKCAVGKRSVVFALADVPVFLCLLPLLFLEKSRLLFFVLCALYVLALGLLRTLAGIRRFLSAMVLGGVFCSAMIGLRYVFSSFLTEYLMRFPNLDRLFYLDARGQNLALIVMVCPIAIGLFRSAKSSAGAVLSAPIFLVLLLSVFCGASVPLWIALLVALAVQNVMTYRFALVWYLIFGFSLIFAWSVTPVEWFGRFLRFFGFASESERGNGLLSVLGAGNVLGFLILTALCACFVFAVIRFARNATRPEAFPRVLGAVSAITAFAVLLLGDVTADERGMVFFILLLVLPRVSLICAKREEIRLPY